MKYRETVIYCVSPPVDNETLNALWAASWPEHRERDFRPVLERSLVYVCAYDAGTLVGGRCKLIGGRCELIGMVNLAWDGGAHAFLLDPTVHPAYRRRGIGTELVRRAAGVARERGVRWLHVDYEPHLAAFYEGCGFRHTEAGLIDLSHTFPEAC